LNITQTIAKELNIKTSQVEATMNLLDEGATVPFIARYRKEATGGLSDTHLRDLAERLTYLNELTSRQQTVLKSIEEQGKLTAELKDAILSTETKTRLEDLYLPYKPKRRTKAQIAREAGLEPLAQLLLKNPNSDPHAEAAPYVNADKKIDDAAAALLGARHIIAEAFTENADLLQQLRELFCKHSIISSNVIKNKETDGIKFSDYFDFDEAVSKIPSHRLLAIFRGQKEGFLQLNIKFSNDDYIESCHKLIAKAFDINLQPSLDNWIWQAIVWAWKFKLQIKLELELLTDLKIHADEGAINVFRDNLKNLLMAAPAGNHVVLGLDPGFRTGVKTVVVDGTGKLLDYVVILPHAPQKQWDKSLNTLARLCKKHQVKLISIGNGTASRETDQLAAELIGALPELGMTKIVVSEAGASVYSASSLAAKEFPDLDVSYRGAVSIARRLQDPLAELVKIDPKSIGVGQYQHDVNQVKLERSLNATVEDCVNTVGTDVNTASAPLLASISGLNETTANNIVQFREQHGRFKNRNNIKKVPRMGEKSFEQAAGFLRIVGGDNPLDSSSVHPESYPIVQQILAQVEQPIDKLIGNESILNSLDPMKFVSDQVGLPTIRDILDELKKPGRDPRPEFKMARFTDGINEIKDLKIGMVLEGVITNVAAFGAFVDIGVHQDGLVHVSQISDHYVKDVQKEVKVGQIVTVHVLEVDAPRKRISLSMKKPSEKSPQKSAKQKKLKKEKIPKEESAFGSQLKDALKKR
jgi:uncharacterized protein